MGKALNQIEDWARRMMEPALAVSVAQHDDGTQDGMYDLSIDYVDRPRGAAEVTREVDGSVLALSKVIYSQDGRGRWIIPELRGGWAVSLRPSANGKRVVKELPPLLAQLESNGVTSTNTWDDDPAAPFISEATSLGIVNATQYETSYRGSVYPLVALRDDRSGGVEAATANAPAEWIGAFLRDAKRADVLAKLDRSEACERHVFIVVAGLGEPSFDVFDPLTRQDVQLPTVQPDLPPEVTHVWLTTTWNGGRGLRWDPAAGWLWFERVTEAPRDASARSPR
jgi:hypothetical protein